MAALLLLTLAIGGVSGYGSPYSVPHRSSYPNQGVHPPPPLKSQYFPERPTSLKGHFQPDPVGSLLHDAGHALHPASAAAAGPAHPHHPYGSGGPYRTEHPATQSPYAAVSPLIFPRHLGVGAIFADLSPEKIRALNRFITSICRMCKYKRRYKDSYGKSDKYGHEEYASDHDSGRYHDDEDYHHDDDEEEDYDYHPFARSLFGPAVNADAGAESDNSTSTSKAADEENFAELKPEEIPSVSRAKRSVDYQWPNQYSPYSHGGYGYVQQQQPYGYRGYVQDSYFRHNPHYLYSKLAFIEHKLKEKRRNRRRHRRNKSKGHGSKTSGGYNTKGKDKKDKSKTFISKVVSNYGVH